MHITRTDLTKTRIKLTITADENELKVIKDRIVNKLGKNAKIAGFRAGKAPLNVIEKHLDQSNLQSEFLEEAINVLYTQAVSKELVKSIGQPEVSLSKFVPFTTLEIQAEVDILGVIKVADYKNIKKGKIYSYKMVGQRNTDYQHFYLIKGRWVHSSFVTKVSDNEMVSYTRKLKIKKLLNENKI